MSAPGRPRDYDYIVVGGGTAGGVLASRLSDDPALSVLLVEAGPRARSPLHGIPGACLFTCRDPRWHWGWHTEPQPGLQGRALPLIQAKLLGGGSAINGMVHTRGPAAGYDEWRDLGCDGWGWDDVLPWFRGLEDSDRGAGPLHGSRGPFRIVRAHTELPIAARVEAAAAEAGFAAVDDLNAAAPDGLGYYDWNVRAGRRGSVPAEMPGLRGGRANLTVRSGCGVDRLIVEGDAVVGVRLPDGEEVRAEREVAVCAGAIGSAAMLLRSGIGPAAELRALGIAVHLDQPHVGRNLQNHLFTGVTFACAEPITYARYRRPAAAAREVLRYAAGRRGLFASGASVFGGFVRSRPELTTPDMQLFVSLALFRDAPGFGALPREHGYGFMFNQGSPHSRGTVRLRSAAPDEPPLIDPAYVSDRRDMDALLDAGERIRTIAAAPALAGVTLREISPGLSATGRAARERHIRATAGNHYHVAGTCRMGATAADSVVDPRLRVHGLRGLRVADASIMPRLLNGNSNAPVTMIAARAAHFMREAAGE